MIIENSKTKIFLLSLAFTCFLLFNGIEFLHHHEAHHDDSCKACSLIKSVSSAIVQLKNISFQNDTYDIISSELKISLIPLNSRNTNSDRAPPANFLFNC